MISCAANQLDKFTIPTGDFVHPGCFPQTFALLFGLKSGTHTILVSRTIVDQSGGPIGPSCLMLHLDKSLQSLLYLLYLLFRFKPLTPTKKQKTSKKPYKTHSSFL